MAEKNHPLVTVAVAVYNIEQYIERCVISLKKQSYENLDILLIDDGSSDRSGEICDHFAEADSRIRVIHKKNGGLSDVRNVGVNEAAGFYLMFVDGDDYVDSDYVKEAVLCAERHQADIVFMDFAEIEESTKRVDRWSMDIPRETVMNTAETPEVLLTTPCAWNKLYRSAFLKGTELTYPVGRVYEDFTMAPRLLVNAARIVYLQSKPLYFYILHEGSIMRSKNFQKSYHDRRAAMEDILSYFKEHGIYTQYHKELEYLAFVHIYFTPVKEILLDEPKSPYLKQFREYAEEIFPEIRKNPYINKYLSPKDKIMYWLIERRMYGVTILLSKGRKCLDMIRHR